MKNTTKIYAVLARRLVQKLKKKANLYVLQQESQQIIKKGPTKTTENFAALKNFGNNTDKPKLQYIHDVSEAHYIHRMHPTSHCSLHNCYIKTYIVFYFVSQPKRTKHTTDV